MTAEWFDELEVGQHRPYGSYVFTLENIRAFAQKFDPQPFHLDEELGRASVYGGLCASGWHTAAAYMQCCARAVFAARDRLAAQGKDLPPLGPSPGFENLKWLKPVFPGDTVTFAGEVIAKRELNSRPDWGLLTIRNRGVNQHDEAVFEFTSKLLVGRRDGGH